MEEDLTLEVLEALETEENLPKLSIFAQNGTRLPPLSHTVGLAPSGPRLAQNGSCRKMVGSAGHLSALRMFPCSLPDSEEEILVISDAVGLSADVLDQQVRPFQRSV